MSKRSTFERKLKKLKGQGDEPLSIYRQLIHLYMTLRRRTQSIEFEFEFSLELQGRPKRLIRSEVVAICAAWCVDGVRKA
jgi:hypothetical protein